MKICKICGRRKHDGLCDMATLDNGHIIHASRIDENNMVDGVRVKNRWIKRVIIPQIVSEDDNIT